MIPFHVNDFLMRYLNMIITKPLTFMKRYPKG